MIPSIILNVAGSAVQVYMYLIFAFVITSWFENVSWVRDVRRVLAPLCEPYLQVFRNVIPPMGGLDFSPAVAIIVLSFIQRLLYNL